MGRDTFPYLRVLQALSRLALDTSRDGCGHGSAHTVFTTMVSSKFWGLFLSQHFPPSLQDSGGSDAALEGAAAQGDPTLLFPQLYQLWA